MQSKKVVVTATLCSIELPNDAVFDPSTMLRAGCRKCSIENRTLRCAILRPVLSTGCHAMLKELLNDEPSVATGDQ